MKEMGRSSLLDGTQRIRILIPFVHGDYQSIRRHLIVFFFFFISHIGAPVEARCPLMYSGKLSETASNREAAKKTPPNGR